MKSFLLLEIDETHTENGQGNYALASHNYGDMTLLFSPLVNLKVGDKIYTTDLEYVYEYENNIRRINLTNTSGS